MPTKARSRFVLTILATVLAIGLVAPILASQSDSGSSSKGSPSLELVSQADAAFSKGDFQSAFEGYQAYLVSLGPYGYYRCDSLSYYRFFLTLDKLVNAQKGIDADTQALSQAGYYIPAYVMLKLENKYPREAQAARARILAWKGLYAAKYAALVGFFDSSYAANTDNATRAVAFVKGLFLKKLDAGLGDPSGTGIPLDAKMLTLACLPALDDDSRLREIFQAARASNRDEFIVSMPDFWRSNMDEASFLLFSDYAYEKRNAALIDKLADRLGLEAVDGSGTPTTLIGADKYARSIALERAILAAEYGYHFLAEILANSGLLAEALPESLSALSWLRARESIDKARDTLIRLQGDELGEALIDKSIRALERVKSVDSSIDCAFSSEAFVSKGAYYPLSIGYFESPGSGGVAFIQGRYYPTAAERKAYEAAGGMAKPKAGLRLSGSFFADRERLILVPKSFTLANAAGKSLSLLVAGPSLRISYTADGSMLANFFAQGPNIKEAELKLYDGNPGNVLETKKLGANAREYSFEKFSETGTSRVELRLGLKDGNSILISATLSSGDLIGEGGIERVKGRLFGKAENIFPPIDYSSVVASFNKLITLMDSLCDAILTAKSAKSIATAIEGFSVGVKKLVPEFQAIKKRFPEFQDMADPPIALADVVGRLSASYNRVMGELEKKPALVSDPAVQNALSKIGEAMTVLQ